MNPAELKGTLEAIIYAADEPATLDQLANATGASKEEVRQALEEMTAACAADDRGIEIRRVARGYRYSTKPQHHEVVRKFLKSLRPPVRLSMPALETLAVIAYRQPITLPEIQEIRGVNCGGVIQTLLEKRLVTTAGRKAVIGRPILYRTTKEFLLRFGLNDLDELPSLKEFEQMAREALASEGGIEFLPEESQAAAATEESAAAPQPAESGAPAPGVLPTDAETPGEEIAGTELAAAPAAPAASEIAETESRERADRPAAGDLRPEEPDPASGPEPSP